MHEPAATTGQQWLEAMFVIFVGLLASCGAFFVFLSIYKMFLAYRKKCLLRQHFENRQQDLALRFPRPQLCANKGVAHENEHCSLAQRFSKHLLREHCPFRYSNSRKAKPKPNNKGKGKGKGQGSNTLFATGLVGGAAAGAASSTGMFPSQNFTLLQPFADHIPIPSWLLFLMAGFVLGYLACLVVRCFVNRQRAREVAAGQQEVPADDHAEMHGDAAATNADDDIEDGNRGVWDNRTAMFRLPRTFEWWRAACFTPNQWSQFLRDGNIPQNVLDAVLIPTRPPADAISSYGSDPPEPDHDQRPLDDEPEDLQHVDDSSDSPYYNEMDDEEPSWAGDLEYPSGVTGPNENHEENHGDSIPSTYGKSDG